MYSCLLGHLSSGTVFTWVIVTQIRASVVTGSVVVTEKTTLLFITFKSDLKLLRCVVVSRGSCPPQ